MSDLRKAAQQALEALEWAWGGEPLTGKEMVAIAALRAALAEPDYWQEEARRYAGNADYWRKRYKALAEPEQEPVAWMDREGDVYKELPTPHWCPPHTPLYAHPPTPRKPLKEDEIADLWDGHTVPVFGKIGINPIVFARAIERAHGIGEQHE